MTSAPPAGAAAPGLLLVDDDADVRAVLGALLSGCGFRVWLAASGAEAVELLRRQGEQIDLALLDVRMPGLDGPATLRELRRLDPGLRCCFFTGEAGDYDVERLLAQGAARVFLKPLALEELAAALRQVLAGG